MVIDGCVKTVMKTACSFRIDRQTDPQRQFTVDGNGLVMTTRRLDRESQPSHRVHVLAVDKGIVHWILEIIIY